MRYEDAPRTSPRILRAPRPPSVGDDAWRTALNEAAARLRAAGVGCVYLLHGTFVGDDPFGFNTVVQRLWPGGGEALRRKTKAAIDRFLGDQGNYSSEFAADLEHALNVDGGPTIHVRRLNWTSEDNHVARLDGAVRLIDELTQLDLPPDRRALCWGHSHGGNVLALVTTLLADRDVAAEVFRRGSLYYRNPLTRHIDMPRWERVVRLLTSAKRPVLSRPLDMVTFGTPLRYGWHPNGYSRLLHIINHRPIADLPPYQTALPRSLAALCRGETGDFTQQLGIAGCSLPTLPLLWRTFWSNLKVRSMMTKNYSPFSHWKRMRRGRRLPDDGETFLIDYGDPSEPSLRSFTGHLHYTLRRWLPFHTAEVARGLYTDGA